MDTGRYVVRIFSGGIQNWYADNPNVDSLAKVFDLGNWEQSVYEVASGEDECLAAAAHKLSNPKRKPEAISILRIDSESLVRFGIQLDRRQFGTTGVPHWDYRHQNLLASRQQLVDLVRFLVARCQRGHDYVRRIEKELLVRTLNRICEYPPCHCPEHVKSIAKWCQSGGKIERPNLSLTEIEAQLSIVEFEDEAVEPRAAQLSSGDHLKDWYTSLSDVRREYAEHYVSAVAQRFRLRKST